MKSKQRTLVLALAAPLLLWGAAKVYRDFFGSKPAPQQIMLGSPQVLVANLPFALTPRELEWSPNGKYIALGGSVGSLKAPRQIRQGVVVRFKTSHFAAQEFHWSDDGRLWVTAGDGWDVYAAPFSAKTHVVGNFPRFRNSDERDNFERRLTFEPNRQLAVLLPDWEKDADRFKFEIQKQGKHFYDVQLQPRQKGIGRGLGTPVFSPDGSALAFTVSGWIRIKSAG